jgi:diaminopimelate decarboxylase
LILNGVDYAKYKQLYADAALQFQTPVFVFDQTLFGRRIAELKQHAEMIFRSNGLEYEFAYAGKAFLARPVATLVVQQNLSIDTCTEFEMRTALSAGVAGAHLGLHGNNKSDAELELAIEHKFARIVLDSAEEVKRVARLAKRSKSLNHSKVNVFLRVTTGVHAGGHEYISTGHEDQKFGVSLLTGQALQVLEQILQHSDVLNLKGIHSHIGSQITAPEAFVTNARKMIELRNQLYVKTQYLLPEVDLGGGFAISYLETDEVLDICQVFNDIKQLVLEDSSATKLEPPKLLFEPGRYLIGPCMSTVYSVGTVKDVQIDSENFRRYICVDGGMADNIRPSLYNAQYSAYINSSLGNSTSSLPQLPANVKGFRIVGKHCESGDVLIEHAQLSTSPKRGDLLVIPCTGAYGYSMASNYNLLPKPAVVAINDGGQLELMLKRQQFEDLNV